MAEILLIEAERLLLRPLTMADAPRFKELMQDPEIAANGLNIPQPYQQSDAEQMIERALKGPEKNYFVRGVVVKVTQELIGIATIIFVPEHHRAEIGYWIGKAYWNHGYATEAARTLLFEAFERQEMNRVEAKTFIGNQASARVIEKLGMKYEGTLRAYLWHALSGEYKDLDVYSLLKSEYEALHLTP